jgi:uncharacterized protein YuzE
MAAVKIPPQAQSVINYDEEADVLYVSFGKPRKAEGIDIGDGTILRVDPETGQIVGITILDFKKRTGEDGISEEGD